MSNVQLDATTRSEFGKGAARRIRRADQVPAVVYGHGEDPRHIVLDGHAVMLALKNPNAVLELTVEGESKTILSIAKDIQRHPVTWNIVHLDLIIIKRGEKVEVEIPVHVTGEAAPGTLVSLESQTLLVEAEATKLPEAIEADIEGREVGEHLLAGEVKLPANVTLVADPESLVVNVSAELTEEELEAELESDAVEGDVVEASEEGETSDTSGDDESGSDEA